MIYLSTDHRGFELKEKLKKHFDEKGMSYEDMGAFELDLDDDYPDAAYRAAQKVAQDSENNRGILICGSGVGVAITANKVKGVYCAQVWKTEGARSAREHDGVNAIALAADHMSEKEAIEAVEEFLQTPSKNAERHVRRFKKIQDIEQKGC